MMENGETYRGCEWLEGGLAISPRGLHLCCVSHHDIRGWPRIGEFDGGPIPVDLVLRVRETVIKNIQSGELGDCDGCPRLTLRKYVKPSASFTMINLSHFTTCNLQCGYCYLEGPMTGERWWNDPHRLAEGKKPLDLLPMFRDLVENGHLTPDAVIMWGGGEPTLLSDFGELLTYLTAGGYSNYVATNGVAYSESIEKTLPTGRLTVVTSIDAGTPETYRRLKKRDYFHRVWEHLGRYASAGKSVEAKYIITDDNASESDITAFVRLAAQAGIHRIIGDVDAFSSEISEAVSRGIGLLLAEANKLGVPAVAAGCGTDSSREKRSRIFSEAAGIEQTDMTPRETFVFRLYHLCLGRSPDPEGFAGWVRTIETGALDGERVAASFFDSDEFKARCTTDEDFVDIAYAVYTDEYPGDAVSAEKTAALGRGMSRDGLIAFLASGDAFRALRRRYEV